MLTQTLPRGEKSKERRNRNGRHVNRDDLDPPLPLGGSKKL